MINEDFERDEFVINVKDKDKASYRDKEEDEAMVIKNYYNNRRKFTDKELKEMAESFGEVVVNDFSDMYHLSDEERYQNAEEAKICGAIRKSKKKCNNITDYIVAMRLRIDAVDYVAAHNLVMPPDEFKKKFAKKKIVIPGLQFPKYYGKNKSHVNWDYVSEYISDRSLDPNDFKVTKRSRSLDDDEYDIPLEERRRRLFSDQDYENIIEKYIDFDIDYSDDFVSIPVYSRKIKKLCKDIPELILVAKDHNKVMMNDRALGYAFNRATSEDFDDIGKLDKRNVKSKVAPPVFTGKASSRKDVEEFLAEYEQWERENVYVDTEKGRKTQSQIDTNTLRSDFEQAGWNVLKFSAYRSKIKKERKARSAKREKKKTRQIADNIRDANKRNKKRKHKKNNKCVEKARKEINDSILELSGGNYDDFEAYEAAMSACSLDKE